MNIKALIRAGTFNELSFEKWTLDRSIFHLILSLCFAYSCISNKSVCNGPMNGPQWAAFSQIFRIRFRKSYRPCHLTPLSVPSPMFNNKWASQCPEKCLSQAISGRSQSQDQSFLIHRVLFPVSCAPYKWIGHTHDHKQPNEIYTPPGKIFSQRIKGQQNYLKYLRSQKEKVQVTWGKPIAEAKSSQQTK